MSRPHAEGQWRGSLWNPFFDRLLAQEPPLGAEAMRLAIALGRLTFGYNKTEAALGTDLVRRTAGLYGRSMERARDQLIARDLLEVEPGSPGRGKRTVWRLLRHPPDEVRATETSAKSAAETYAETSAKDTAPERGRIVEAGEEITTTWDIDEELGLELDGLGLTARQRAEVDRHPPELVRQWLEAASGKHVLSRAALLVSGLRSGKPPSPHSLARAYVAEHGWPTGSRWIRGTHASSYVADPLGHDRPEYAVPWETPSLAEIEAALKGPDRGSET